MTQRQAVKDRLNRLVESFRNDGRVLQSGEAARLLLAESPDCGLSLAELSEAVIAEAAGKGVPVEMDGRDQDGIAG